MISSKPSPFHCTRNSSIILDVRRQTQAQNAPRRHVAPLDDSRETCTCTIATGGGATIERLSSWCNYKFLNFK
ncbi:uncharacterized protein QC763_0038500 [Podospora pseudopauciseta]|uniref:Uncharacterized protein n=1 Tax=Podospora pseudopauciseta TaxID=2093780 RepID=A0ABR0HPK0_9PEZI|nr:hypothetical protein QC763_0038500 [Podospora pseudopauciseta]